MLKKLAHNSTIPSLAGNSDLRPLQDLIIAEKAVLVSLQKLSVDIAKASEALRIWALDEGDDIYDTLNASTTILSHFSTALSQYSSHEHNIRDHLKAVRTREEALEDMKRQRKSLHSKADSADRKLGKMSPEHKNLALQTEILNKLREDIAAIDTDIMAEGTGLADFKRKTTRAWMGLKFGGLLECCEKGIIVGEVGKLVVAEIPEDVTQPGSPRSLYRGHEKVSALVTDAQRRVEDVKFSAFLSSPTEPQIQPSANRPSADLGDTTYEHGVRDSGTRVWAPAGPKSSPGASPNYLGNIQGLDSTERNSLGPMEGSYPYQTSPALGQPTRSVDDFGVNNATGSAGGGKFATFPVKSNRGMLPSTGWQNPPSPSADHPISQHRSSDSFSSSIAMAGDAGNAMRHSFDSHSNLPMYSQPGAPPINPWKDADMNDGSSTEELQLPYTKGMPVPTYQSDMSGSVGGGGQRHVRFGRISDADSEPQGRLFAEGVTKDDRTPTNDRFSPQVTLPAMNPDEEERALNAAAAREISRELDTLNFNPPPSLASNYVPDNGRAPLPSSIREPSTSPSSSMRRDFSPQQAGGTEFSPSSQPRTSPLQLPIASSRPQSQTYAPNSSSPTVPRSPLTPPSPNFNTPLPTLPSFNLSTSPSLPMSAPQSNANTPSPNRMPPDYSRSLGSSPISSALPKSTPALNTVPATTGPRTIPAAAFRRPQARVVSGSPGGSSSLETADTSPLLFKKRSLPSSPYPPQSLQTEGLSSEPLGNTSSLPQQTSSGAGHPQRLRTNSDTHRQQQQQQQQQQGDAVSPSFADGDHEFDYLSAYVNTTESGPVATATTAGTPNAGYGEGRFATDLEGEMLR